MGALSPSREVVSALRRRGTLVRGRPVPEATSGQYDWAFSSRDGVWTDKLASLADRAARSQWEATRDIPWEAVAGLRSDVERGVSRVMTYIAQNEYAAYYIPARYLAQVNPEYVEVLMWLAAMSTTRRDTSRCSPSGRLPAAGGPSLAATELFVADAGRRG
jgi:hypothetical protein